MPTTPATLALERTAAYSAMLKVAGSALPLDQRALAEFLEDWPEAACTRDETFIPRGRAIAAVRLVTVETSSKVATEERSLSASRSALQQAKVEGAESALPAHVVFACVTYLGLAPRTFSLRVSVLTGEKAPMFRLHLAKFEQHAQEMGQELADLVRSLKAGPPVFVGSYKAAP
jgi:uncharacterized protein YfdQ (DUF2303 family)